ncbi:MAG: DUF86 domain-containing protein [Promethearchaeota archaeon]
MDKRFLRLKRYRDKISYITENLSNLPEHPTGGLEKAGVFYQFITSVEAAMDLIAMYLKDTGSKVDDDYSNIEAINQQGRVPAQILTTLRRANGLRNRLVHRYNKVDEDLAFDGIREVIPAIFEFIEQIEEFLDGFGEGEE